MGTTGVFLHYSAKPKKGVVEWKDQKGDVVAVATPAVHGETEAEKLEILVEIVKENMDFLVGCWTARILKYLQKEVEKGIKGEQWTRALLKGKVSWVWVLLGVRRTYEATRAGLASSKRDFRNWDPRKAKVSRTNYWPTGTKGRGENQMVVR